MRQKDVHVRRLELDDYDELMALWQQTGLHSLRPKGRDSRTALAEQLASGVQTMLGLEIDGQLVAAVVVTHDSRKGWINRLVVKPEHRRQGYAQRLIEEAEHMLREQGMQVTAALIESDNSASLALFQQAGYVEVDENMHYLTKRDSDDV
jgi:ribosomal protein S18 acetylase RimI-like enzyme